jgi:4-hydroxybenzoate polyprenyltransferase
VSVDVKYPAGKYRTGSVKERTPRRHDIGDQKAPASRLLALIRTSHPGPSLAITAITALLAIQARPPGPGLVLFVLAALTGQLSIGWSNDAFDAGADAAGGRLDKPIVAGTIGRGTVAAAGVVALTVSVVAAFVVAVAAGVINLVMVAAGWAYNAKLKSTVASGLMYVVGFGLIPAFAVSWLPGHPLPRWWAFLAAALLGLGAHFANVLPDLAADRAGGVDGLPQRVAASSFGPAGVRLVALTLLLAASALIVLAPGGPYRWPVLAGLAVAAVLAVVGARARGRTPFRAAIAIAALDVVLFIFGGAPLI